MNDTRFQPKALDVRPKVELAQALPGGLLNPAHHPKRGEVDRIGGVREIASYSELEYSLLIGGRVRLAEIGCHELLSLLYDDRRPSAIAQVGVEFDAILARHWRGAHENQSRWGRQRGVIQHLYRIKQRQHPAPRISNQRWRPDTIFATDRREISNVIAPRDRRVILGARSSTTALIVQQEIVSPRQMQHLGEQVPVVGARASVE